ncbi:peptidase A22B family protein [Histomonas meleagridis]|uniref:peptidase A22B family protein n=1 Tax=Histomonas meleagridis TaxID=135588 RepID=UPI003559D8D7|nr:peptidase A22B family protein [Histomonas meleagridis]KAH0805865.1 peptidase A22B family protein [Histomonas meleagridis]
MDSLVLSGTAVLAVGLGSYFAGVESDEAPKDVLTENRIKSYPFMAALTLVTVNLLFEYFSPSTVNYMFSFYFGIAGTNSIWFLLRTFIHVKSPKLFTYPASKTVITEFVLPPQPVPFYLFDVILYLIGISINIWYYKTRSCVANDIIAFCIAFFAILSIRIEKFTAAAPFLWSLLIYDTFFVYSTDVMSSVATNLQGPVKLQFDLPSGTSILGLGDLVIPGIFISVCSRFDAFIKKVVGKKSPYWIVAMVGYAAAMVLTDFVCNITGSGQPALLFITPALTLPIVTLAFVRKEQYAFLSFSG